MSYSNGLLPSSSTTIPRRGLPGVGFQLTDDGNYDMDGKRLTDLADPVNNKDATTKAYVDGEIVRNSYYYFTSVLKHNNTKIVKFPAINKYPYSANDGSESLRITLDGDYQIIYSDFYKKVGISKPGQFIIHNQTDGIDLLVINLQNTGNWLPITINAIIPISVDNGHADIKLYLKDTVGASGSTILDGYEHSTFFIKYLGP